MMGPFRGFLQPKENWSKLPHQLIEALPLIETLGELEVVLYILRHTWGFGDEDKKISIDEFRYGRKRRNGTRLDHGTGLTEPTLRDGLSRAALHGFISVEIDDHDKGRVEKYYRLTEQEQDPGGKKFTPGGERKLPPPPKNFTPRGQGIFPQLKDSCPRTEKETSGEIPLKETEERGAAPPSLMETLKKELDNPSLSEWNRQRLQAIADARRKKRGGTT